MDKIKILFVCKGNICRSPMAYGIFRDIIRINNFNDYIDISSCGTSSRIWGHEGHIVDNRAIKIAKKYNCDISDQVSRQLEESDFFKYDYIIVMDQENIDTIKKMFPNINVSKISKILEYSSDIIFNNVPDPYFEDNFEKVFLMIKSACEAFFKKIKLKYNL